MTWTPLLKNQVINKRSVKDHNYRGKAGQSNAVRSENVRTSIEVFVTVLEEGKWGKLFFFTRLCPGRERERESNKTVCEYVCMRTLWSPLPFIRVSRCFFLQSLHFLFLRLIKTKTIEFFVSDPRGCFFSISLRPPRLFFFCDLYDFKNPFFLPSQVMRAFQRGAVAQQFCKLIARNACDVCV